MWDISLLLDLKSDSHAFANVYGDMWDKFANVKNQITTRFEVRFAHIRKCVSWYLRRSRKREISAHFSIWSWDASLLLDLKAHSHTFAHVYRNMWDTFANGTYEFTTRCEARFTHVRKYVSWYVRHIRKCQKLAQYSIWRWDVSLLLDLKLDSHTFAHVYLDLCDTFANERYQCISRFAVKTQFAICIGYELGTLVNLQYTFTKCISSLPNSILKLNLPHEFNLPHITLSLLILYGWKEWHASIWRRHVNLPYTCQFAVYMPICRIQCTTHANLLYLFEKWATHINLPYTFEKLAKHINLPYTNQVAIYIFEISDTSYSAVYTSICRTHFCRERHISICRKHVNLPYTFLKSATHINLPYTYQFTVYNVRPMLICRIHMRNERHSYNLPYTHQFAVYMRDTCQFVVYIWEMSDTHQFAVYTSICRIQCATHVNSWYTIEKLSTPMSLPYTFQFAVYNARHMTNCHLHLKNERHTFNLPYTFQFAIYNARHMSICGIHLRNERHTSICRIHFNLPHVNLWYTFEKSSDTHPFAVYMSICHIQCATHVNLWYTFKNWATHINLLYTFQFAAYNARHMTNCRLQSRNERHTYNLPYTFQFAVYNARHMSICGILSEMSYTYQFTVYNARHMSICGIHLRNEQHTCQFAIYMSICRIQCATHDKLPFTFEKWATHI